jgi:2-polyprenyl-6-methoxyphenol hydroxylase-like FAD-dependent oxidoreductase
LFTSPHGRFTGQPVYIKLEVPMAIERLETACCVVGGGPAGMILGYLLARAGVGVTVLEKHKDFNRDFRGDTVHPSTLDVVHELGLLEDFLKLPHQKVTSVGGRFGDFPFKAADFSRVPAYCKFVALMPQWEFLNFLSARARSFPAFDLRMEHEAVGLIHEDGRITGVEVRTPSGSLQVRAGLVVGSDGRHSTMRSAARLDVIETGVPVDVLWFRISRLPNDPDEVFGNVNYGRALILINRGDYFQSGLIIRKGSFEQVRDEGLEAFRHRIRQIAPWLGGRVEELRDWDQVKLLTVQINHLRRWHAPGVLCIGDAAHAMSPAGGVGINLAIQDAVAAANILAAPLRERKVTEAVLDRVRQRREFPTRLTQLIQINAHKGLEYVFQHPGPIEAPWQFKAVTQIPGVQHLVGRVVGMGVRPEHPADAQSGLNRIAASVGRAAAVSVNALRRMRRPAATERPDPGTTRIDLAGV